ncbi:hypothetical protein S40285_10098 [Stachybotrys chlorohalonatus IBT 40285]|uniref:Uncharacterized protein n=1 Tax=Stachybotrys chlorohalonatus (strain IBT 40285) TaxID=1283841 RepID=A0A084R1N4_STAC4|nr:hypothetical protein S40285_10098 [Stachybotrys chlorohalonata IBT 40285]
MADATIGVSGYFLMTWRYNTAKQHGLYEPKTVRYLAYTSPPETKLLVNLMDKHYSTPYSRCDVKPRGHDTSEMLVQALKQGDNDPLEEKIHLEFSHLSIGASNGNIHCERGLDLLAYDNHG